MDELHNCQLEIQGRGDADDLNASSPLQMTLVRSEAGSTLLAVRTDASGLIGLLRHLHARGHRLVSIHYGESLFLKEEQMSAATFTHEKTVLAAEPRWKDLYTVGGITCILSELIILFGIVAYFIWPYMPGYTTADQLFSVIHNDPMAGLMALDFFLLVGNLVSILLFLALYVSLRRVNQSYGLIALALGLIAAALIVPARPIVEMFNLSNLYSAATGEAARSQFLAAGEALQALFNGTSWVANTVLGGTSLLVSSLLMLRSNVFSKTTAWVGIVTNIAVLLFFIPGRIGMILLFLSLPGYLVWYIQMALRFFRMGRAAGRSVPGQEQPVTDLLTP